MPCEPANRTLPSWDLATLGGVSQIQLFSLRRHPKWRNIWDSVERIQTVYLDTSRDIWRSLLTPLPDILWWWRNIWDSVADRLEYWAAEAFLGKLYYCVIV